LIKFLRSKEGKLRGEGKGRSKEEEERGGGGKRRRKKGD
jgi:hypothetical protein